MLMPRTRFSRRHYMTWTTLAAAVLMAPVPSLSAQWSAVYSQARLPASHNGAFRAQYGHADRLLNSFDFGRALVLETIWRSLLAHTPPSDSLLASALVAEVFVRAPRAPLDATPGRQEFRQLAPEVQAVFDWTQAFRRQVYDVLADGRLPLEARNGRIAELVAYYRTRPDLALSARPKNIGRLNAGMTAMAFRRAYPRVNGLLWATQWLEIGLLESLLPPTPAERRERLAAGVNRFGQLLRDPESGTPHLMPMAAAVAPEFARRFPDVAVIMDNLHMLQDHVADILLTPEIPRSAKRQDLLRAAAFFRSDTAGAMAYSRWAATEAMIGANNMGGPAVGFEAELPQATVPRGVSVATGRDSTDAVAEMAALTMAPPGSAAMPQPAPQADLQAIHDRMMADPVIRERVATDPVLQRMLAALPPHQPGQTMPGMTMPGMQHGGMAMESMSLRDARMTPSAMSEARRVANDFIVRLLADPAVEARIHELPELHALWSDPDVQRRIRALRRASPAPAAPAAPAVRQAPVQQPPAAGTHGHPPNPSRPEPEGQP